MENWLIPLLAQEMHIESIGPITTHAPLGENNWMLIPIVAMAIPIIIVPVALAFRFARQGRDLEHAQRMRALELGRPMPGDPQSTTPMNLAVKIGVYVPVAALGIAWLSSNEQNHSLAPGIWMTAGLVATSAVIGGTVLAFRAMGLPAPSYPSSAHAEKPAFDPDAYDHVGARG